MDPAATAVEFVDSSATAVEYLPLHFPISPFPLPWLAMLLLSLPLRSLPLHYSCVLAAESAPHGEFDYPRAIRPCPIASVDSGGMEYICSTMVGLLLTGLGVRLLSRASVGLLGVAATISGRYALLSLFCRLTNVVMGGFVLRRHQGCYPVTLGILNFG